MVTKILPYLPWWPVQLQCGALFVAEQLLQVTEFSKWEFMIIKVHTYLLPQSILLIAFFLMSSIWSYKIDSIVKWTCKAFNDVFYRCLWISYLPSILNNDILGEGTNSAILKCFKISSDLNISFSSSTKKYEERFSKKGKSGHSNLER